VTNGMSTAVATAATVARNIVCIRGDPPLGLVERPELTYRRV